MADAVIELANVSKRYAGHVAVRDLSLHVPAGRIFGLLGPNGAGKTTTLRMVNDILRPDEGRITLFGALPPGRAAVRRIGYLPEERGLYPKMTVRNVLTFLAELRGLAAADAGARIDRWLARLELGGWIDRKIEELSKGMQQKVQFIATVLHEPELLILDEPFSGLDPLNADLLRAIVREQREAGRTILFSTHLMEHAEQMCDSICILAGGEKVLEGGLAEVKRAAGARKRRVVIELEGPPGVAGDVPPALRPGGLPAVRDVRADGARYEVELADGAAPGDLFRALGEARLDVRRFEPREPTLHEIFVEEVRRRGARTEQPASAADEAAHG